MDTTRRNFFEALAAAGAATAFGGCASVFGGGITRPVALQLWSVHKIFWDAPEKHLAAIRQAGFDGVEFAGYGNRTAKQLAKMLGDAGLRCAGTHLCGDKEFSGDGLKKNLDFCAEAGIPAMCSAWADYDTRDGWVKFGKLMGEAAAAAEAHGVKIGVHNHCHEFTKKYDGRYAWDWIFAEADKRLQLQLDTSQVVNPGFDCVTEIKKYPGRHFSIHVKENVPSKDGYFGVPPDDGGRLVDWEGVVRCMEADPSNKWYVIECERRPDSLEPAAYNVAFLRRIRV